MQMEPGKEELLNELKKKKVPPALISAYLNSCLSFLPQSHFLEGTVLIL